MKGTGRTPAPPYRGAGVPGVSISMAIKREHRHRG